MLDLAVVDLDDVCMALEDHSYDSAWWINAQSGAVSSGPSLAADLRPLYGPRLVQLAVVGSRARRDADAESDLDLLVVLDDVVSPWEELGRMDEVLWHHTQANGVTVSALPVGAADFEQPTTPALIRARAEAVPVA